MEILTVLKNNTELNDNEFDVVGRLPVEIVQKILLYLPSEDLRSATSCCLTWNAIGTNDFLWKKLCQRDGYFEVDKWNRSTFYNHFLKKYPYWQGVYWYNDTIYRNWETDNYREVNFSLGDRRFYWYWCFGDTFACISEDMRNLYVYNLKAKEIKRTVFLLKVHSNISGLELFKSGKYLVYFIYQTSITVWNLENESTVLHELWDHVTDIYVDKNLILLVELWGELKVFNMESGQIEYEIKGMFSNGFIMDGRIVFTSENHVIHILKWDDKSLIKLTCCNEVANHKILVRDNLLLSFCKKPDLGSCVTLCIWNTTTKTKLHSIFLGKMLNLQSASFLNKYLCLIYDNCFLPVIELWDYVKRTQELQVFFRTNLFFSSDDKILNNHFIIALRSCNFSVWSLKKKEFIYDLNFSPHPDKNYHIVITETTLGYVQCKFSSRGRGAKSLLFHLRDYEI